MAQRTFQKTRLTPSISSSLFTGDVLYMKGGKFENEDIRIHLEKYVSDIPEAEILLANKAKDEIHCGMQSIVQIARGATDEKKENGSEKFPIREYSPCNLVVEQHPLSKVIGHGTVSSSKTTNRLWNGTLAVEYDLVETDNKGRKYMFLDADELARTFEKRSAEIYEDNLFDDIGNDDDAEYAKNMVKDLQRAVEEKQGPIVSGSKLLTELKILAEVFRAETERYEKTCCMDPVMRNLLLPPGHANKPMFGVAFTTNIMCMGFKAIFYTTALQDLSDSPATDVVRTEVLHSVQTELLLDAIPKIVNSVESAISNKVKYFKIDPSGTKNLCLPGNTKNDDFAMPYHRFKVQDNGIVEISNKELVTTLGVKNRADVSDWMRTLKVFDIKCMCARAIDRSYEKMDKDEWVRRLLFSHIADALPFKNRTALVDLDYYISGLCYNFLCSEYGMMITKDNNIPGHVSASPVCLFSIPENNGGGSAVINGDDASTPVSFSGALGNAATVPSDSLAEGDSPSPSVAVASTVAAAALADEQAPPVPLLDSKIRNLYDTVITSDKLCKVVSFLVENEELGLIITDRYASTVIDILSAKNKPDKKALGDTAYMSKRQIIGITIPTAGSMLDKTTGEYNCVAAIAVLQMVIRHIIRDLGIGFGLGTRFLSVLSGLTFDTLDFSTLWMRTFIETRICPSVEYDRAHFEKLEAIRKKKKDVEEINATYISNVIINAINNNTESEDTKRLLSTVIEALGKDHDSSSFATNAFDQDTMFLWTIVILAERFCQIYSAVNNPEAYYRELNGFDFEGGLEKFKKLCEHLKPELDVFVKYREGKNVMVCREQFREAERVFESKKNSINRDLMLLKGKELYMTSANEGMSIVCKSDMSPDESFRYKSNTEFLVKDMFNVIKKDITAIEKKCEDENEDEDDNFLFEDDDDEKEKDGVRGEDDESDKHPSPTSCISFNDDIVNDFFNRYSEVKSFTCRSALCHRQEFVSIDAILVLDKFLSGYIVTPKVVKDYNNHEEVLKEVRERSARGHRWVIPFSFPISEIKGDSCKCEKCVKLLCIPESNNLKQLVKALRFNTMACERRFFTDASMSLGFVKIVRRQQQQHHFEPIGNQFDTKASKYCGYYNNVVKEQNGIAECLKPRLRAIYGKDYYVRQKKLRDHISFFTGLWAMASKANLEESVLTAVMSRPSEACFTLSQKSKNEEDDSAARRKQVKHAFDQIGSRSQTLSGSFLEMVECTRRINSLVHKSVHKDRQYFLGLIQTYRDGKECNGTHLHILFSNVKQCFDNSLPVDWKKLLGKNITRVFNVVKGAPNSDESGALFECARFMSTCARIMLGTPADSKLTKSLSAREWEDLLSGSNLGWIHSLALDYESVMNVSDARTTENFINASAFLSGNDMLKHIGIKPTENEKIRYAPWSETKKLTLDERVELLVAIEKSNRNTTFSTVLMSCALFRVLIEGYGIDELPHCPDFDFAEAFIRSLTVINATRVSTITPPDFFERCVEAKRFVDIDEDHSYFYKFAAYVLGMLANDDQFFEDLTGTISEAFDFNGYDTRNWNDFIEKHFISFLLGRRAFLTSRPAAFIKRMVGAAHCGGSNGSRALSRLAKLVLIKSVDSDVISVVDLITCCLEDEKKDVDVKSVVEYYTKLHNDSGKKAQDVADASHNKTSNACSNEQLAKQINASRIQDVRVGFHNKSQVNKIERDEEEEADLSYELYSETVEKAIVTSDRKKCGGGDDKVGVSFCSSSSDCLSGVSAGIGGLKKRSAAQRKHQEFYDHINTEETNGTFVSSYSRDGKESDLNLKKAYEFSDEDIISANDVLVKRARVLMRQNKIKWGIRNIIDRMSAGMKVICPINSDDDPASHGLTRQSADRIVSAVAEWNEIVKRESEYFKKECQEIEKNGTYDMRVVFCQDYSNYQNSGYDDEVHIFKNDLFGDGDATEERRFDNTEEKVGEKRKRVSEQKKQQGRKRRKDDDANNDTNEHQLFNEGYGLKDVGDYDDESRGPISQLSGGKAFEMKLLKFKRTFTSNAQHVFVRRLAGYTNANDVLFKLRDNRMFDANMAAEFFDSKLVDTYFKETVPCLMNVSSKPFSSADDEESGKKKKKELRHFGVSAFNVVRANDHLNRSEQYSNNHNSALISLYDNRRDDYSDITNSIYKEDILIPIRSRSTASEDEMFSAVKSLWLCNSGIHPRDQIEMFKKLVFRNYNKIWIKMYCRFVDVLRKWGVLSRATIDQLFFSVKFNNTVTQIIDNSPPTSVLHSKFLPGERVSDKLLATRNLMYIREYTNRILSNTPADFSGSSFSLDRINRHTLNTSILCREFISGLFDARGDFSTSRFTNKGTMLFTPGTSTNSRDYERHIAPDRSFVGQEQLLEVNSMTISYSRVIEALRIGVFEPCSLPCKRILRLFDKNLVVDSGSMQVVSIPSDGTGKIGGAMGGSGDGGVGGGLSGGSYVGGGCNSGGGGLTGASTAAIKRATASIMRDGNYNVNIKRTVCGSLTSPHSQLTDSNVARNMLMTIRRVDKRANGSDVDSEMKKMSAEELSLRYIVGSNRGFVFYGDEMPKDTSDTTYLHVLKKSFRTMDYSETSLPIFFSIDWLSIATVGGTVFKDEHLASLIQACIPVDRRIKVGSNISFSDLAAKRFNGKKNSRRFVLSDHLSSFESRTGIEKRGVLILANPLMSMNWFLMRARHLRMSCTNSGVASLCLMMCNRENKMELEHRIHKGLATVFDMIVSRNSCISVDNNRFFLIGGSYLLGGRIEDVNLKTDMFVRCKLRTEKQIVHESLFDSNVTSAFLATCIEGTSMTRGLSLIEHISRLVNSYEVDIRRKNYWSVDTSGMKFPVSRSAENKDEEESVNKVGGLVEPAVCIDDENYIFLRMLYSIAVSMNDSSVLGSANTSENFKHVAMAVKRSYEEVVNQENGIPRMHSLYHLKALMNFCGFVSAICTGDGEKAHHLMYTLTSVGLNMTPKTVVLLVGVVGNNLKSTVINVVKSSWWDMYTDLGVDALVNKGDAASSDAKLAYVAGKRYIFVMEEVGYQGSVSSSASKRAEQKGFEGGSKFKGEDENPELSHQANNEYRYTVATRTWQNVFSKLKENKIRLFEQEIKSVNARSNENGNTRSLEMYEEDEGGVSSSVRRAPPSHLESKLTSVINAVSKKVSWWNHINGPTHNTIGRDKTINGIISNRELPFCISNENDISDSTWLSESDNISINNEGMDRKEFVEAIRHKNFTTKNTFAEMVTKIMTNGYNKDDEWHNDMGDYLLPPSSTSTRKNGGGSIIYAMHAHDRECPEARIEPSRILGCPLRSLDSLLLEYVGPKISKRCDLNYPFFDEKTKKRSKRATPFIERTIAQILHSPQKHSFPRLSLDGSNLFQMNSLKNEVLIDKIIKSADKNCGRVGQLFNEIVSISLLNEKKKENNNTFDFKKLINDDDDTGLITSTTLKPELHTAFNRVTVKSDPVSNLSSADRNLLLSLYDYDKDLLAASSSLSSSSPSSSSLTQTSSVLKEAIMASNRMNRDTPMTSEMLPGQVSSNIVKQVASTKSSRAIRGLHSKPVTCSVTATPVMISNSYVLKFYVDKAMYKRLLIFSCETNFTQKNVDPDVEVGDNMIRRGLQVIHSDLLFRRSKTWCQRGVDFGNFLALRDKRINDWRAMGLCGERNEKVDHIASVMPSMLIRHVMSKGVLELSESSNLIKLEESGNTFFQAHGSLLLSSKPSAFVQQSKTNKKKNGRENESGEDGNGELNLVREKAVSHKQMCTINPKHLDTLQLCIDRSKSNGVWGLVNAAFRSAVFVDFPFVKTSAVWGEGSTTKLLFNNGSTTINWSSGLRLPDTEGIKTEGTLGVGDAVRRQLVEGWGSNDIRDIMYTCHHLHMIFELVVQHSNAKIKLDNVGNMTMDADFNIAFMLACSAYIDMFGEDQRFFVQPKAEGIKKSRYDTAVGEEDERSKDVPLFMALLINKDLRSLRSTTNLAHSKLSSHRRIIEHTLKVLGRKLNRDYVCEECGSAV